MKRSLSLLVALVSLVIGAQAHAYRYYYTGIDNTQRVARYTATTLTMWEYPVNCTTPSSCFAVGWTKLHDKGYTNRYIEAGIGYQPGQCSLGAPVKLYWKTPSVPGARTIACVPLGTEVRVSIQKNDGQNIAFVTWEWGTNRITREIIVHGWTFGPGTHPTKVEVYSASDTVYPRPVRINVKNTFFYPQDFHLMRPQQMPPYLLEIGALWENFTVSYR